MLGLNEFLQTFTINSAVFFAYSAKLNYFRFSLIIYSLFFCKKIQFTTPQYLLFSNSPKIKRKLLRVNLLKYLNNSFKF